MMNDQEKIIQTNRKNNLRKVIIDEFDDNIDKFAAAVDKHRNFIYALLWDTDNPNSRKITDKMARFLEKKSGMVDGFLDSDGSASAINKNILNIPFLEVEMSTKLEEMKYSVELSFPLLSSELYGKPINSPKDLFAVKVFDNSLFPFIKFGDTVIIDYSMRRVEDNHYYLVKYYGIFYLRKAKVELGEVFLCSHVAYNSIETPSKEHKILSKDSQLEVLGIVVFTLLHSQPYFRS
ncbi:MAG: S24 family peptidase [Neisseriaceae bacterium]|nr:MAG: S24 family peptidase [Neisseriaceae bacterium]